MKYRTGKECKKTTCKNYVAYSHWFNNLQSRALSECMECKNSHVSQFVKEDKK